MKPTQLILPAVLACCSALCCCGSRSLGCSTFLRCLLVSEIRGGTFPPCLRAGAVHRRLACRYWAGRVALRENRARLHLPAGPRGSEAARPKINLFTVRSAVFGCVGCIGCFFTRGQSPLQRKGEQHLTKHGIIGLFSGAGAVSGVVFVNLC